MSASSAPAVRVNGLEINIAELLRTARMKRLIPAVQEAVRSLLVRRYAEQNDISADDAELNQGLTELRKELGLYSAAETREWLTSMQLSLDDLGSWAEDRILSDKVKAAVTEPQIEPYFVQHRLQFDRVDLSQLVTSEWEQAQELQFRLEDGADFFLLVRQYSLHAGSRYAGGHLGLLPRSAFTPAEEAAVFGAEPGRTVGPFLYGAGFRLLHINELHAATLDEETRQAISRLLFEEWLDDAAAGADIELPLWDWMAHNHG